MKVIGIDPAPAKNSMVFDGKNFYSFNPIEIKDYLSNLYLENQEILVCWDAPLSAAIDANNFSLTIRQIERFFNRNGRHAKVLAIPEGISTLGYSGCPHWTISQYLFGYPILNPSLQSSASYELLMSNDIAHIHKQHIITEIHPALSMWILLKDTFLENKLFASSWKYKGDNKKETIQRRAVLIKTLLALDSVKEEVKFKIEIKSDDELDAFVCWFIGVQFLKRDSSAMIYGDKLNGSFLLPYDKAILKQLNKYLYKDE